MSKPPFIERARAAVDAFLFPAAGGTREQRTEAEYMPDRLSAFFLRPARLNFVIVRATFACFLLLFVWSALAHLEEVTVGEGKVIPSSQVQVIQNLEGGIVNGIPVKVGDLVQRDQIVLHIDPTASPPRSAKPRPNTTPCWPRLLASKPKPTTGRSSPTPSSNAKIRRS